MASEREKTILMAFVQAYNKGRGTGYTTDEWPEETERAKHLASPGKAIDAKAHDSKKTSLALEHTIIEAFENATANDKKFEPIIREIRSPAARLPSHHIIIYMHLDSMNGLARSKPQELAPEFRVWFDQVKLQLPEGMSERSTTLGGRQLTVKFCKRRFQDSYAGLVTLQLYPQPKFQSRLRKTVRDKVGKLKRSQADEHVLLLERRDCDTPNFWQVHDALEQLINSREISYSGEIWVSIPRQSRGPYGVSRSKRLERGR